MSASRPLCLLAGLCVWQNPPIVERAGKIKYMIKAGNRGIRRQIKLPFCDFNFYEFRKKPVLPPPLWYSAQWVADAYPQSSYLHKTADIGARATSESILGDIFRCHTILFPSYSSVSFFNHVFSLREGTEGKGEIYKNFLGGGGLNSWAPEYWSGWAWKLKMFSSKRRVWKLSLSLSTGWKMRLHRSSSG